MPFIDRAVPLVITMCLAEVLNMVGIFAFPTLLPNFMPLWELSNTEAGWISGIYFAGYTLTVPIMTGLTDHIDPRRIYLGSSTLGIAGALGFALFANGFWTALFFRILAGFGLAGTFIPGLRALIDRLNEKAKPRAISFYTATFSLGTALSFFATGFISEHFGWRWAFGFGAFAGVAAFGIVALALRPQPYNVQRGQRRFFLDFRPIFRNRQAIGYILAYSSHTWELFAARSWIVAYLTFAITLKSNDLNGFLTPSTLIALTSLVAMWASVGGAELAFKFGRFRILCFIMWGSALYASILGFIPFLPYPLLGLLCIGYFLFVQGESAALHVAIIESAKPSELGLTMAFQSLIGFSGAFLGPLVVGLVLDFSGGGSTALSWGLAFLSMGFVVALGPLFVFLFCRDSIQK